MERSDIFFRATMSFYRMRYFVGTLLMFIGIAFIFISHSPVPFLVGCILSIFLVRFSVLLKALFERYTIQQRARQFIAVKKWKIIALPPQPDIIFGLKEMPEYFAHMKTLGASAGISAIQPKLVAEIAGTPSALFGFGFGIDNKENTHPLVYIKGSMNGVLQGWARLRPASSAFTGAIKRQELESASLNREVQVHGYPAKCAYQVFPPDYLDWYQRLSSKPWVIVNRDQCTLVIESSFNPDRYEQLLAEYAYTKNVVERSGGLQRHSDDHSEA
jgi:hypothetical protein